MYNWFTGKLYKGFHGLLLLHFSLCTDELKTIIISISFIIWVFLSVNKIK